jgi:hypothetical protein
MLTDVQLLGTGLELKKGERVGYIRATNIPGGGVFVRPAKLRGIWKMASRDDSIYIRPEDFLESIRTTKMSGSPLRDNPGARYRVGGGYQTFTLEEAKKEADRIFREKGIIVSIEEYKAIPQVKPDWKYGIYTGRGIARNPKHRTHGLNIRQMTKLYRMVRAGNRKAVMYARRVLGIPMSESLSQVAAVVYHHINDLRGKA